MASRPPLALAPAIPFKAWSMDLTSPSSGSGQLPCRTLADLSCDAFAHCASFLGIRDISNIAIASKSFHPLAYSDAVWSRFLRVRWPNYGMSSGGKGAREEYFGRLTALQQFKFTDPTCVRHSVLSVRPSHVVFAKNDIFISQGQDIVRIPSVTSSYGLAILRAHGARITCMRLFPLSETSFFRGGMQEQDTILVTSSSDRTIRLWWKDHSQRCFKGHSGPVTVIADTLLGDCGAKLLATGGEDCTVRLWSVGSGRMNRHLAMTYHGHEKAISLLSVAKHKASLLMSLSRDSKVKVWDTTAPSSTISSSCVGMTSVFGPPVSMKCDDSLCYIAAGRTVIAIDLRTMKNVSTVALHSHKIYSLEMLLSKWLLCTGGDNKAMLWDIRKNNIKPEPIAELEGHTGPVKFLHMDSYKIVTGGPDDSYVNVWETDTRNPVNSLHYIDSYSNKYLTDASLEFSAMAVDGCRIATSGGDGGNMCFITIRDFSQCSVPLQSSCYDSGSKFWEDQQLSGDSSS